MTASTFLLRRLPLCAQTSRLSRTSYPAFTTLQQGRSHSHIRPSASLYSTKAVDLDQTNKPYYITTPIFYVNAGTARSSLVSGFCNIAGLNLIRALIYAFFVLTLSIVPHIGHLHSAVLADTFKRFHEMKGRKAIMSTGTDEHGLKVSARPEMLHILSDLFSN